jgi:hypothetical protein
VAPYTGWVFHFCLDTKTKQKSQVSFKAITS